MNKSALLVVPAVMILAALGCASGSTSTTIPGSAKVRPSQTPSVTVGATAAAADFTRVRLHKGDGDLSALIKEQAGKAAAIHQQPYVELDATWCPPCIAIKESLEKGDPLMIDAFAGTYIIQVDVDDWQNDLDSAGYSPNAIPIYYEVDSQGKQTGRTIDGGAWGDNIPENMAPPLKEFFRAGAK
jgi:hypothetical protein